jgi:hypothetical protein
MTVQIYTGHNILNLNSGTLPAVSQHLASLLVTLMKCRHWRTGHLDHIIATGRPSIIVFFMSTEGTLSDPFFLHNI